MSRLETSRLLMREWREGDLDAYAVMAADPEVMRYVGGVRDRARCWRAMATDAGHWVLRGYGQWALERRADGALLGHAGLWNPEGWPGLEVGWTLARHAWGQGYAAEAGAAAIDWAWRRLDAPRLISVIDPGNTRSVRVAEGLGLRPSGEEMVDGKPATIFVIERARTDGPAPRPASTGP